MLLNSATNSERQITLPPHYWDKKTDVNFPELDLVSPGQSISAESVVNLMSSSFGFGGNNFSLILGRRFD